jgi:hypothetical protein
MVLHLQHLVRELCENAVFMPGRHSKKPGSAPGFSLMRSFAFLQSCVREGS